MHIIVRGSAGNTSNRLLFICVQGPCYQETIYRSCNIVLIISSIEQLCNIIVLYKLF